MYLSSQLQQETENRRTMVPAGLDKKQDPFPKITRAKRAEVMAQVVECLSSKCKTLISNPIIKKKKRKEKGRLMGKW
jgi:hypothetical protein